MRRAVVLVLGKLGKKEYECGMFKLETMIEGERIKLNEKVNVLVTELESKILEKRQNLKLGT